MQSKRSSRRPSTAKRIPASTATIAAATPTAVSQHEPQLRQVVGVVRSAGVRDEERQRGAEQPEQQDLSQQPGLEVVTFLCRMSLVVGRCVAADKPRSR